MIDEEDPALELQEMDDLQRMVTEMYGGKLLDDEVNQFLRDRKLEAQQEAEKLG